MSLILRPCPLPSLPCSWDGTVCCWDAISGVLKATLKGHTSGVTAVAFVPSGETGTRRLLSASDDKSLRLWDVDTGESANVGSHAMAVTTLAVSPDGRLFASGSEVTQHAGTRIKTSCQMSC